jgi:hypothetical protein
MANKSLGSSTGVEAFLPNGDGKTPLQQALESLNVNLEQELMRFRQSRSRDGAAQPFNSQLKFRSKKRRRGLNLIQVQAQSAASSQPRSQQPAPRVEDQPAAPTPVAADLPSQGPAVPTTSHPPAMPPVPSPQPSSLVARQGLPSAQTYLPQENIGNALQRRGGAIAPYHQLPNDYLESTEALLDSLSSSYDHDQGYEDLEYEPSLREQLATPLGIGALLLLLVGSAGFGYMVTSPKTAEFFRENALVQALFGGNSGEQPEGELEPSAETTEAAPAEPETGLQGIGPDLSEDEFQDLDLGRLSTLDREEATPSARRTPLPGDLAESEAITRTEDSGAGRGADGSTPTAPAPSGRSTPSAVTTGDAVRRAISQPTNVTRPQVPARPQPAVAPTPRANPAPRQPTVTPLPQVIQTPQPAQQVPPQPMRSAPPTPAAAPPTPAAAPPQPLSTQPVPQPLPQPQAAPPAPLPQSAAPPASSSVAAPANSSVAPPAPITQPPPQSSF